MTTNIEFFHQYPANSGTEYTLNNSVDVGDVIILMIGAHFGGTACTAVLGTGGGAQASGGFVSAGTAILNSSGNDTITCLKAVITTAGIPKITVTAGAGDIDLGFSAWSERGLTGAVNLFDGAAGAGTTLSISGSIDATSSLYAYWLNEAVDAFSSWGGSISDDSYSDTHYDQSGHERDVALGSVNPSVNVTDNDNNTVAFVYMTANSAGVSSAWLTA